MSTYKVSSNPQTETVSLYSIWRSNFSPQECDPFTFLSSEFGKGAIKGLAGELNVSTGAISTGDRVHPLIANVYRCWLRWKVSP